jgi:hypothetical protein
MTNEIASQLAHNLVYKFYYALPNNGSLNIGPCNCNQRYAEALTCALIAVDEIIQVIDPEKIKMFLFWKEVKIEIEKKK